MTDSLSDLGQQLDRFASEREQLDMVRQPRRVAHRKEKHDDDF